MLKICRCRYLKYQSGRAGDEAKKRKSPAKSGRVGITVWLTKSYGLYPSHGALQVTTLFGYFRRTQKENRAKRSSLLLKPYLTGNVSDSPAYEMP